MHTPRPGRWTGRVARGSSGNGSATADALVATSPAVTMDETGWRIEGLSAWLWAAATTDATVYDVAWGRGYDQACGLVPAGYSGTIVRDGWAPYRRDAHATHQSCIAHLLRRCAEMTDDLPDWARHTPRDVKDLLLEALDARHLPDAARAAAVVDIGERIDLLIDGPHPHDANRGLVKHLANERPALLRFLTHPGVEATNFGEEIHQYLESGRTLSFVVDRANGPEAPWHLRVLFRLMVSPAPEQGVG